MARSLVTASWLEVARAAFFEELYRGKNVLWLGTHDPRLVEVLLARGAARVTLLAAGAEQAQLKKRYAGGPVQVLVRLPGPPPGTDASRHGDEDVAFVSHAEELFRSLEAEAAGQISYVLRRAIVAALRPDGWLVAAAGNGDEGEGLRYFELADLIARDFAEVTMTAQLGMAAVTLAPFGQEEAEPRLDDGLAGPAKAEMYVAIGGPRRLPLPYGLMALPSEAVVREAPPKPAVAAIPDDSKERLAQSERALGQAREAALKHAEELRQARVTIGERDAFIAELERGNRVVGAARIEAAAAVERAERAETQERAARRRAAELEGTIVRMQHGLAPLIDTAAITPVVAAEAGVGVAEITAKLEEAETRALKLQAKAEDLQREAWQHMRARSEAEAAAAEVREDTVRKLKDARKIANVELMRAMEEAMRKATTLKEEAGRAERERKEATAALASAREELAAARAELVRQARAQSAAEEKTGPKETTAPATATATMEAQESGDVTSATHGQATPSADNPQAPTNAAPPTSESWDG